MNQNRDIHLARAIAIIGVVLIHSTSPILWLYEIDFSSINLVYLYLNQLGRYAVPFFIFISAFALSYSNKQELPYFTFINQRLVKLLPKYLIWSSIYICLKYFLFGSAPSLTGVVKGLLLGSTYFHLYFIPLIIQFYFIFPFVYKFFKTNFGLLTSFLLQIIILVVSNYSNLSLVTNSSFFKDINILNWIFYFALGIWLNSNRNMITTKVKTYYIALPLLFSLFIFIESYWVLLLKNDLLLAVNQIRPSIIIYTCIMLIFVLYISSIKNKILSQIANLFSKYSFDIYLSHIFFITLTNKFYPFSKTSPSFLITLFFSSLFLSILTGMINNKVRIYFFRRI